MVFMLCGQFDILYASLKNLDQLLDANDIRERQENYKADEQELNQFFISTEKFDSREETEKNPSIKDALTDCVKHHQMLLEFVKLLQDFFGWFIFSKLIYSGKFHQIPFK